MADALQVQHARRRDVDVSIGTAVVVEDYTPDDPEHIPLQRGDTVDIFSKGGGAFAGIWKGECARTKDVGLFRATSVNALGADVGVNARPAAAASVDAADDAPPDPEGKDGGEKNATLPADLDDAATAGDAAVALALARALGKKAAQENKQTQEQERAVLDTGPHAGVNVGVAAQHVRVRVPEALLGGAAAGGGEGLLGGGKFPPASPSRAGIVSLENRLKVLHGGDGSGDGDKGSGDIGGSGDVVPLQFEQKGAMPIEERLQAAIQQIDADDIACGGGGGEGGGDGSMGGLLYAAADDFQLGDIPPPYPLDLRDLSKPSQFIVKRTPPHMRSDVAKGGSVETDLLVVYADGPIYGSQTSRFPTLVQVMFPLSCTSCVVLFVHHYLTSPNQPSAHTRTNPLNPKYRASRSTARSTIQPRNT